MSNTKSQITDVTMENYLHDCRLKMGETIREIREKRGYSQDELAAIMEVNRSTISKIENGKFSFSIDYLSRFSWFLDFDLSVVDNKEIKLK
ncbi:multiprotein-bridging factor 1 family protein [Flavobacterium sp. LS2P90]|jgi:DNA-binding XRE family transcriptional regulator|uniref:Multiprotein-bridging factor 1 family protein n=1 Tax=Flavobacterium xylosi TaxID=3230415 RepID=A0ABW6HSR5_9FLAO